jgi:transketolase
MSKIEQLKKRILDISIKNKLSHLYSCLSSVGIIYNIYKEKTEDEAFVLSNGHAALALYVVLEDKFGINAEDLWNECGTHPCKNKYIDCSTGSLGLGLPIAVGMALANTNKNVYCLISDGECDEGTIWESLRFINTNKIDNIKIFVNANGISAYQKIDINYLTKRLLSFYDKINIIDTSSGESWDAHYYTPTQESYDKDIERFRI